MLHKVSSRLLATLCCHWSSHHACCLDNGAHDTSTSLVCFGRG